MKQVPDSLLAFQHMFPDDDACAAGRILYDDGHSTSCKTAIGKTQGGHWAGGCVAARAHDASRMRQKRRGRVLALPTFEHAVRHGPRDRHKRYQATRT